MTTEIEATAPDDGDEPVGLTKLCLAARAAPRAINLTPFLNAVDEGNMTTRCLRRRAALALASSTPLLEAKPAVPLGPLAGLLKLMMTATASDQESLTERCARQRKSAGDTAQKPAAGTSAEEALRTFERVGQTRRPAPSTNYIPLDHLPAAAIDLLKRSRETSQQPSQNSTMRFSL